MTDTAPATISHDELQLAARNHALPLEALRYDITPVGLHYLLIHFDIPRLDAEAWRLQIGGLVGQPVSLSLDELRAMPAVTSAVTLECAGNGRAYLAPRPVSQPWLLEAVGTGRWKGVPVGDLLALADPAEEAVEVVFTGADRGIDGGIEQAYQRSLTLEDATELGAFVAYELNGEPLPPQHGFPLRLIVPGWYGMASVKWLTEIAVVDQPFDGYQQAHSYRLRQDEAERGAAITRIAPRSLMVPPGIPDFLTRQRRVGAGGQVVEGRAWSGHGPITDVAVSTDGGCTWDAASVEPPALGPAAWQRWTYAWEATPGEHVLCCRATDSAGTQQPLAPTWNLGGYTNNAVQRVVVHVA